MGQCYIDGSICPEPEIGFKGCAGCAKSIKFRGGHPIEEDRVGKKHRKRSKDKMEKPEKVEKEFPW